MIPVSRRLGLVFALLLLAFPPAPALPLPCDFFCMFDTRPRAGDPFSELFIYDLVGHPTHQDELCIFSAEQENFSGGFVEGMSLAPQFLDDVDIILASLFMRSGSLPPDAALLPDTLASIVSAGGATTYDQDESSIFDSVPVSKHTNTPKYIPVLLFPNGYWQTHGIVATFSGK